LPQQLPAGVTAIVLSGYGTPEDIRASLHAGFAEHLVKPISPPDLLAALARAGAHRSSSS
jgi:two-component system CheB/CheR fusion protein